MTVYIYALIDPRDNSSRYVGMTRDPNKRLYQHRSKSHNEEIKVWASELDDLGLSPTMRILEEVDDGDDWRISETYWVRQALKEGWPILNKKTGGDNSPL
ncbi:MAG TPA: GIY-YIG nuclease family protein, partial [Aggregatilineales bacterium]|nr:GIY-YIG nuclease family protein [Aggregatilineales bacterium]